MKTRKLTIFAALLIGASILTGLGRGVRISAQPAQEPSSQSNDQSVGAIAQSNVSLQQANLAIESALAKSEELNVKMDIAVVDAGGNLKAFARMDEACLGCVDIAIRKARTARMFDRATGELGELSQPGSPLYGIEHSNDGLVTFPGGVFLTDDGGKIIGAIGVSGDTVDNDDTVARAGADSL
ncbi:MAG: heme-binding protein [Phormidesmis sp.]